MRGTPDDVSLQPHWHNRGNGSAAVVVPTCRCGFLDSVLKGEPSSSSWAAYHECDKGAFVIGSSPLAIEQKGHCLCEQRMNAGPRIPNEIAGIGSLYKRAE